MVTWATLCGLSMPPSFAPAVPLAGRKKNPDVVPSLGGPKPGSNFDYAAPLTEVVLLGNLAIRSGRRIEWDSANMKCTNVPEALTWRNS